MQTELTLTSAWNIIEEALSEKSGQGGSDLGCVQNAVALLHQHGMAHVIEEWFFHTFQRYLQTDVAPQFWSKFKEPIPSDEIISHVCMAFGELYSQLSKYTPSFDTLVWIQNVCGQEGRCRKNKPVKPHAQLLLKAVVFTSYTRHFHDALHTFYSNAFKAFHSSTTILGDEDDDDDNTESLHCPGCEEERENCCCKTTIQAFHTLNSQLRELGLLERLSGEAVSALVNQHIRGHVEHTCKGNFETAYLEALEQWLDVKVVGWLELLYGSSSENGNQSGDSNSGDIKTSLKEPSPISAHRERLYHDLYHVYANIRIEQLFNIIIEFPESEPALLDLKSCLEKTSLRSMLVQSLKTALETRLLHPGVNTADILTAYISAIRALRVLDPTGVLLELVCEPVRKYLRNREDTVRCIVSSLTEDSSSELSDELVKGQPLILDESYHSDDDGDNWEAWEPDPVDADPGKMSQSRRTSDIISMLVNIYGSKELFVNEYRTLLADRILTYFNYDTEKEIRYLELLKLRFGESQLHYCEVMLKDVADSKRINAHITEQRRKLLQEQEAKKAKEEKPEQENKKEEEKGDKKDNEEEVPVNGMILSAQFWPSFREENLELPKCFQKSLDKYTKSFETLKGNRTLNWKTHLGQVNIEIELKGRSLELSVSPVHATIIWYFQEKARWTVEELSTLMHLPTAAIRRKIAFWQSHGLLKEEATDTFVLVEDQKGRSQEVMIVDEDETESAMASASDQREEELQVLWSYIVGMLTNLESLPLDRIHSMLKMFAMQGPSSTECSVGELKAFLDRKVKEQKLMYSAGVYRLPKPGS